MSDLTQQATSDYLKVIYEICTRDSRASTGQIAGALGVTPASVTGMLKKLSTSEPVLLDYRKHQGVVLTDEGEKQALQLIRKHRLLECFLCEALGYSWDEVHEEAERLEHAVSGAMNRRIAEFLQEPGQDPHGSPIPTRDLRLAVDSAVGLDQVEPGRRVRVRRVDDDDADLLRFLGEQNIVPGAELVVLARRASPAQTRIRPAGSEKETVLSTGGAGAIYVDLLDADGRN